MICLLLVLLCIVNPIYLSMYQQNYASWVSIALVDIHHRTLSIHGIWIARFVIIKYLVIIQLLDLSSGQTKRKKKYSRIVQIQICK
ncbi:hypothetical protein BDW42DRAFT_4239 [Aspergillus taichungensis]|uniref:Uncharacterized protein n=1 Tax=Aspergillus taichungensis TaxID=482145 RepID=A0A2J5HK78_9EURO|nr:hypothetical protein BDW42DRAFT_4239 [Aspergillus taichungensis]